MEKELQLQPRLQCIASLVPQGARLADVGTENLIRKVGGSPEVKKQFKQAENEWEAAMEEVETLNQ